MPVPFNVWLKNSNSITIFDASFAATEDQFQLVFVSRETCVERTVEVSSIKLCQGRVSFVFSLECELSAGIHDATLTNTTTEEVVFSDYPVAVFDAPKECVQNPPFLL